MQIREFEGRKFIDCNEMQEMIHKLLLELDELMEELKVLDIPETKRRERTNRFRDVMGMIFKLNGMDYEIHKARDVNKYAGNGGLWFDKNIRSVLREVVDCITKADEFLSEYR